jgi:hypothetical protein
VTRVDASTEEAVWIRMTLLSRMCDAKQKADVAKHPEAFHHVGLLFNGSPAVADYPLFSRPITTQDDQYLSSSPGRCDARNDVGRRRGQNWSSVILRRLSATYNEAIRQRPPFGPESLAIAVNTRPHLSSRVIASFNNLSTVAELSKTFLCWGVSQSKTSPDMNPR